jgi:VCBS repeat-containing protein
LAEPALAGFFDDFESGFGNWTMNGLWNPEDQGDACGGMVAPFPSPTSAAYYGIDGTCTYDTGAANSGSLSLNAPVAVAAGDTLSFWSYEETECGGVCSYDHRYVEISTDGGATWTTLGQGDAEGSWYRWTYDLSAYAGQSVLIRFRFDTVDADFNGYFGWMVDNVRIGPANGPPLAVDDSSFLRLFGTPIDGSGDLVEIEPLTGAELNRFAAPAPPSEGPDGLAFDGSSLWFLSGLARRTPYEGAEPNALDESTLASTLYQMDPDTGSVISSTTISAGTGYYDGLAALNGLIFILDHGASDIHVFDPGSGTVVATLDIDGLNGVSIIGGLAGIHGPDALLATDLSGWVYEIDPATGLVTGSFAAPVVEANAGLAVLGGQVYLGSYSSPHYTVVDRTGTLLRVVDLPYQLSALGGDDAFVAMVTSEDAPLNPTVNVLINDSDPDFDALSVAGFMNPSALGASVTANGDGSFGYDPTEAPALQALAAGEQVVDTFTYVVTDGSDPDWATVFISVTGLNDAPVAVDDTYVTAEDTPLLVAAEPFALTTTFAFDSGHSGNMFDITTAASDVLITDLDVHLGIAGATTVDIYYKVGSYVGSEFSPADWTLLGSYAVTGSGTGIPTPVDIDDLPVPAGQTYGFHMVSPIVRYTDGANTYSDANLTLDLGVGCQGFANCPFSPRTWNGTIYYQVVGSVLWNDTDIDGDPLTAMLDSPPLSGTLVLDPDGSLAYTPILDFCGMDGFTYYANDGSDDSNVATVTLHVTCVNDPPVATDNEYTTPEDTPYSGDAVLDDTGDGVDYDPDGDPFTAYTVTNPISGTLVFAPDGSFTYSPTVDYYGTVSFTYQLQEGTQIVTVAKEGEPTAPSGVWATVAGEAAGGDRETRPAVQPPIMLAPVGPIAFDEPEFPLYTVVDGYVVTTLNGNPIDPLSFNFTVGGTPSSDATVTTVGPGTTAYIDAPNIEGDAAGTLHVDFGVEVSRVAFGFALSCLPPVSPGAMVTGYAADGTPVGSTSADGIDTGYPDAENLLVFTPGAGCRSANITFNDMGGTCSRFALDNLAYDTSPPLVSNVATVTMTVTSVNDPPLAVDDGSFLRLFATPIDGSGDLVEIEPLTGAELNRFAAPAPPSQGPDGLAFDGSSLWFLSGLARRTPYEGAEPNALDESTLASTLYQMDPDTGSVISSTLISTGTGDYDGLAALNGLIYILDYLASDIHVFDPGSGTVVATLDIDGLNGVSIKGGLSGIHGPDALLATNGLDSVYEIDPATGLVTGSFATPDLEFNAGLAVLGGQVYLGSYWFPHYTVVDRTGTLLRVVDLPYQLSALGGDDAFVAMVTSEDAPLNPTVNVLINDSDPEFDALSVAGFINPSALGATVTANGDGSFGYDPTEAPALQALAAGQQVVDTFTYTVTDGSDPDWATVFISVTGLNDAPVAVDDSFITAEDTVLSIAAPGVLGNDSDVEGDAMTAVLDTTPLSGTLVLDPDGSITYTPTLDFVGIDSFTYHAHDGLLDSGVATVTITVTLQRHLIYLPVVVKQ